jgi:F-type H+-transporting ATPase subunit b
MVTLGSTSLFGGSALAALKSAGGTALLAAETSGISPDLAIVTLIIFLALVFILWWFASGPLVEGLGKREQAVADQIESAAAQRAEAEKLLSDYQRQLERAGDEVRAMLDEARKESEVIKQSIIDEAQRAAANEQSRAEREIEVAKNNAIREIAEHSVNRAFHVARGAVQREIQPDDQRRLIEDALNQFANKN